MQDDISDGGTAMQQDLILVLNFNDAASRETARKLRGERICCRILPGDSTLEQIKELAPKGLILAADAEENNGEGFDNRILQENVPILAWGSAAGFMLKLAGGLVGEELFETRFLPLEFRKSVLTEGITDQERMLKKVKNLEPGGCMTAICLSGDTVIGYSHDVLPLFGLQIEVEQNDPDGARIMRNFAVDICGCTDSWNDEAYVNSQVEQIRSQAGDGSVMCAVTGGLDSAVSAALAYRAVGKKLKCILIDTGLMHEQECLRFVRFFGDEMGMDVLLIDAAREFLNALQGVTEQIRKREIIGAKLREILLREMNRIPDVKLLIRGTNCSDVMQRTFENVPDDLPIPVCEPLRDLFKDEIRRVAEYLGFPSRYVTAQPFPGTGMAMRIHGEVSEAALTAVREADRIFNEELLNAGVKRLMKSFAAVDPLPEQKGIIVILRAVQSGENLSANPARLPYDILENTVQRVTREIPGVKRVFYDLSTAKDFSEIEYNSI